MVDCRFPIGDAACHFSACLVRMVISDGDISGKAYSIATKSKSKAVAVAVQDLSVRPDVERADLDVSGDVRVLRSQKKLVVRPLAR